MEHLQKSLCYELRLLLNVTFRKRIKVSKTWVERVSSLLGALGKRHMLSTCQSGSLVHRLMYEKGKWRKPIRKYGFNSKLAVILNVQITIFVHILVCSHCIIDEQFPISWLGYWGIYCNYIWLDMCWLITFSFKPLHIISKWTYLIQLLYLLIQQIPSFISHVQCQHDQFIFMQFKRSLWWHTLSTETGPVCKMFLQWITDCKTLSLCLSLTGLFNTAFTQYVAEKPTVITSVINTAAMAATDSVNREQASQPQILGQTSAQCNIKETEL